MGRPSHSRFSRQLLVPAEKAGPSSRARLVERIGLCRAWSVGGDASGDPRYADIADWLYGRLIRKNTVPVFLFAELETLSRRPRNRMRQLTGRSTPDRPSDRAGRRHPHSLPGGIGLADAITASARHLLRCRCQNVFCQRPQPHGENPPSLARSDTWDRLDATQPGWRELG